jgi:hypothetical protein
VPLLDEWLKIWEQKRKTFLNTHRVNHSWI